MHSVCGKEGKGEYDLMGRTTKECRRERQKLGKGERNERRA